MAKRISKDLHELTLEELAQLPPDELLAALREKVLNSELIWFPPADHPIFQEWLIFTLPRFDHSKNDSTDGSENSET
jgi:hypothetical protein